MPAPTSRWPDGDSRRFEVGSRRLPANTRFLLDAPQRPSQPSQRDDLLPFFFAQDIAHSMEGMPPSISMSCPLSIGRFSSVPHWPVLGVPRRSLSRSTLQPGAVLASVRCDSIGHFQASTDGLPEAVQILGQEQSERNPALKALIGCERSRSHSDKVSLSSPASRPRDRFQVASGQNPTAVQQIRIETNYPAKLDRAPDCWRTKVGSETTDAY